MKIGKSSFWQPLWKHYIKSPSIAVCRVPELEYASTLNVQGNFLDHCCGDGVFADIAWNKRKLFAGCDISDSSIGMADKLGVYQQLDVCDASKKLPYETGIMDRVFNNSALEHIRDLDPALREVSRVLKPGGEFSFNVLNHRYFEWWPLDETSKKNYQEWQPFYHSMSINEWSDHLAKAGLKLTTYQGYFDYKASQFFAKLDYWFSGYYIRKLPFFYVKSYLRMGFLMSSMLKRQLENLTWKTNPDGGAGYFIQAVKI